MIERKSKWRYFSLFWLVTEITFFRTFLVNNIYFDGIFVCYLLLKNPPIIHNIYLFIHNTDEYRFTLWNRNVNFFCSTEKTHQNLKQQLRIWEPRWCNITDWMYGLLGFSSSMPVNVKTVQMFFKFVFHIKSQTHLKLGVVSSRRSHPHEGF